MTSHYGSLFILTSHLTLLPPLAYRGSLCCTIWQYIMPKGHTNENCPSQPRGYLERKGLLLVTSINIWYEIFFKNKCRYLFIRLYVLSSDFVLGKRDALFFSKNFVEKKTLILLNTCPSPIQNLRILLWFISITIFMPSSLLMRKQMRKGNKAECVMEYWRSDLPLN